MIQALSTGNKNTAVRTSTIQCVRDERCLVERVTNAFESELKDELMAIRVDQHLLHFLSGVK